MMIDRWHYTHAGQTLGPVTTAQLRQLAAEGRLMANDLIWPEGRNQSEAIPAQVALDITASVQPTAPAGKPDWLDDIRAALAVKKSNPPAQLDWLDDVRAAEEAEQAFLTLEWDGDNADTEEEQAKQILDELEGVSDQETPEQVPAKSAPGRLLIGSATTRGRVRDRNEDSLLVQQCTWSKREERHEVALIVVADGMGGHAAGEQASALVVRAVSSVLAPLLAAAMSKPTPAAASFDPAEALDRGLIEANRLVREAAQRNPAWKGMGSTAVVLLVWDGRVSICLVGDCRVYHWHEGKLAQVTRDQTLVARMVELGQLTAAEAAKHPRRNEVAQAVGKYALIEPVRYEIALAPGDWLIAGSDGLTAHVNDRVLGETIAKYGTATVELAERLIELANQGGGSDNCTVVAVRCV